MLDKDAKVFESGGVFTPSAPVNKRDLFAGRLDQIRTVVGAVIQIGQHVVIYGERGVGKTSLANVIQEYLPSQSGIISVKINCDESMDFNRLFKAILADIKLECTNPGVGFGSEATTYVQSLDQYIAENEITPNALRSLFRQFKERVIIIIDEFDRIREQEVRRLVADTIKNFSDYGVGTTFILVGVADSVDSLITEHQSIERALVQVQMPRMSREELEAIIEKGIKRLQMSIDSGAKERILNLSQGLPHYTHLLSLHAVQSALLQHNALNITIEDVKHATDEAIRKTQQTVRESYFKAVNSPRGNLYGQVLLACAMAKNDELGYFSATDVKKQLSKIMKKEYEIAAFARHLKEFCEVKRGPVLKQVGHPRRFKYRFINPLMEPYVVLNGLNKGFISEADF